MTSLSTRSAMKVSRSSSSSEFSHADASPMESEDSSAIERPLTVTARISGLSRLPSQVGHGTSRMYPSYFSRE